MYHQPVMLKESIDGLSIRPDGVYVDATFGSGGHSREILSCLDTGKLIGFDQDPDTVNNLIDDHRFTFINQNFRYLKNFLKYYQFYSIDGLLADLGVSSWQIDQPERGFSFRFDGRLDMRMDREQDLDAFTIVNEYPEEKLVQIFRKYGEINQPTKLVQRIIAFREKASIETTSDLKEITVTLAEKARENQFLAKVFQAIRIEVNDELEALKALLSQSAEILAPGGRLVMITYHSLEDRIVKNYFRAGNFEGTPDKDFYGNIMSPLRPVNRKAFSPRKEEIEQNPRARSAKLRIAEKNK